MPLPVRAPAALAAAPCPPEPDHGRELGPVDGVEEAVLAPDRHVVREPDQGAKRDRSEPAQRRPAPAGQVADSHSDIITELMLLAARFSCAVQHGRLGAIMIGPAEIEDMMLDYAEAEATAGMLGCSEAQTWPPRAWSWGSGPSDPAKAHAEAFCPDEQRAWHSHPSALKPSFGS